MVKVKPKSDVFKSQTNWAKTLKSIDFNKLKRVRTFSEGTFCKVSLVQLRDHPEKAFALKTMQKAKINTPITRECTLSEKNILSEVQSQFIVKLYKTFKDKKYLHLLTEYLPGGELMNYTPLSENTARFYIACVVEALEYLHARHIVHNDIKGFNIVLDASGYAKLIDFGFAEKIKPGEKRSSYRGTPNYSSPEVVSPFVENNQNHLGLRDRAVDLWALGILLYDLVMELTPFNPDDRADRDTIYMNIVRGILSIEFPQGKFSQEAVDFIRRLCAYDPKRRLGYKNIDEIRKHRWFKGFDWSKLRDKTLKPPIVPKVSSPTDTRNFYDEVEESDSDAVQEDESNWDMDF